MISLPRSLSSLFPSTSGISFFLRISSVRLASTEVVPEETSDELTNEASLKAAELESKRNKSRLQDKHYNVIHGKMTVDLNSLKYDYQKSIKYQRKLVARYGTSSGINLGISWPTKQELSDMVEYERVAHPFTIQEMVEKKRLEREEQRKKLAARYYDTAQNSMVFLMQFHQFQGEGDWT